MLTNYMLAIYLDYFERNTFQYTRTSILNLFRTLTKIFKIRQQHEYTISLAIFVTEMLKLKQNRMFPYYTGSFVQQ